MNTKKEEPDRIFTLADRPEGPAPVIAPAPAPEPVHVPVKRKQLDGWIDTWAKEMPLEELIKRLKTELKARGLDDPALVETYDLGLINAAIRAALQLDAHTLLSAAEKFRGEK